MPSDLSLPVPVLIIDQHQIMPHTILHNILVNLGYPEDLILFAADLANATTLIEQHLPNLIFCAVEDFKDFFFLQKAHKIHPEAHLVSLHHPSKHDDIMLAIKSGAQAYLLNTHQPESLLAHIRIILRGGAILHPQFAQFLLNNEALCSHSPQLLHSTPPRDTFSSVESQIVQQLAQGKSLEQTATALTLTEVQVSSLIKQMFRKLPPIQSENAYRDQA